MSIDCFISQIYQKPWIFCRLRALAANFSNRYEIEIERILVNGDFKVKDLNTLERFLLKDTIKFGKGKDFEIREI
jgi:hypothetical protein